MTKRNCKKPYINGEIFLGEALEFLMFDCFMDRNDALKYLGL